MSGPVCKAALYIRDELAVRWTKNVADYIVSSIFFFSRLDGEVLSPEDARAALIDGLEAYFHEICEDLRIPAPCPGSSSSS
jgi:hypothetical protein